MTYDCWTTSSSGPYPLLVGPPEPRDSWSLDLEPRIPGLTLTLSAHGVVSGLLGLMV